uniref:Uncharacterized protein n=1 Tax=Peronospora matthiolae TaxID=2874970 RepID=A0AAV1TS76_9STRA
MASSAGPLCDEPVWGVAFVIDDVEFHKATDDEHTSEEEKADGKQIRTA